MILYLSIIFMAMVLVCVLNIFIVGGAAWLILLLVVGCTSFEFAVDGLFAFLVEKLPDKWFRIDKKIFQVSKRERKVYEKLKIRGWKDKIWELGGLGGFRKNKISNPSSSKYIESFIIHSNKGFVNHLIGCFVGFLCLLLVPMKYCLTIALPVACVNLLLNLLPIMVLRYNTSKLLPILKRLKSKQQFKINDSGRNCIEENVA